MRHLIPESEIKLLTKKTVNYFHQYYNQKTFCIIFSFVKINRQQKIQILVLYGHAVWLPYVRDFCIWEDELCIAGRVS